MNRQVGDVLFVHGKGLVAKLIDGVTFGKFSHVCIIAHDESKNLTIYETEGGWNGGGKSGFVPLDKYAKYPVTALRMVDMTPEIQTKIDEVCLARKGTPYSYWDCIVNGALFFVHPKIRGKVAEVLGTRKFTKCDEEVLRVLYAATLSRLYRNAEDFTPNDLYAMLMGTGLWKLVD